LVWVGLEAENNQIKFWSDLHLDPEIFLLFVVCEAVQVNR